MPNENNKTSKYSQGEKSLKLHFLLVLATKFYYQKCPAVKIIQKHLTQREKLSMGLQVARGL